jgi:hypothetical protein
MCKALVYTQSYRAHLMLVIICVQSILQNSPCACYWCSVLYYTLTLSALLCWYALFRLRAGKLGGTINVIGGERLRRYGSAVYRGRMKLDRRELVENVAISSFVLRTPTRGWESCCQLHPKTQNPRGRRTDGDGRSLLWVDFNGFHHKTKANPINWW